MYSLGILLIARKGLSTLIVRIADRFKFMDSISIAYSAILQNEKKETQIVEWSVIIICVDNQLYPKENAKYHSNV